MFGSAVGAVVPAVLTTLGFIDLANNPQGKGGQLFAIQAGIGVPLLAVCGYGALYSRQRKRVKMWKYVIK
jgi:hypothetical protein